MISNGILDDLQKNSQLYIKVGEGDYEPIGNCTNFELSCEADSLPKINLELTQIPTPDNPIPVTEQTRIEYEPYEPVGKNLFNELKIDDSGIIITCEGLRSSGKTFNEAMRHTWVEIDDMRNCVEAIENTNKYLEKKEGNKMKLLDMYKEKSIDAISDLFDGEMEEEKSKHDIKKAINDFEKRMNDEWKKLKEIYNQDRCEENNGYIAWRTNDTNDIIIDKPMIVTKKSKRLQWLEEEKKSWVKELYNIVEEVEANLALIDSSCTDDEYKSKMEILKNFEIVDETGRLNPIVPYIDEKDFEEWLIEQKNVENKEESTNNVKKKRGRPKKENK